MTPREVEEPRGGASSGEVRDDPIQEILAWRWRHRWKNGRGEWGHWMQWELTTEKPTPDFPSEISQVEIEPLCAAGAYNLGLEVAARLVSPTPHVEEERSCAAVAEQILALRTEEPPVPDLAAALGEPAVSRGLLAEALELLRRWGSAEDCECPPEGHFCGRPYYERLVASIEAALDAPAGKLAGDLLRAALAYYLAANTVEDKVDPWGEFEDAADAFLGAFPDFGEETR